ncbi:MAG: trypsin-like peptidase domain-containing protein [Chloroflexi bacterium]|nr:trypsin-like peptidase domain-containing protein [Chloroflexota bacterium]
MRSLLRLPIITAVVLVVLAVACGDSDDLGPLRGAAVEPIATTPPAAAAVDPAPTTIPAARQTAPADLGALPSRTDLGTLPSLAQLVEQVSPTVTSIAVESTARGLFFDFTDEGAGTGIVVRPDGYIVTNRHVIDEAESIMVSMSNGDSFPARLVGADRLTDLAVIKIDAQDLKAATLGDSDLLNVGDWVLALGNALALKGGPTVTLGIVSARGRTVKTESAEDLYDMIQTDAAINDGNSGGPLVSLNGEVIGINTAILRQAQGIGFTVSSNVAKPIIDSLIEHGRVVRPLIGLEGRDVTPALASRYNLRVNEGIIVTLMTRDGPAYRGGIRPGDIIIKLDEAPTPDMAKFLTLLWTYKVGDQVAVEYITDEETRLTTVELIERVSQ